MDSTLSTVQADRRRDAVAPAPKDWAGAEEALAKLARTAARDAPDRRLHPTVTDFSAGQRVTEPPLDAAPTPADPSARPSFAAGSDFSAGERLTEPSLEAPLRPADLKVDLEPDPLPSDRPSLGRRASRTVGRVVLLGCIGSAAVFGWQAYGDAAKQIIASWTQEFGLSPSLPMANPPAGAETAAESSRPPPVAAPASDAAPAQAAAAAPSAPESVAPAAPETAAPAAPAAPSPELQQLEAMARDLAAVRQKVEELAAGQEQMARDIAKLQATRQEVRRVTPAPSPRPTAAPPARKPAPLPPALSSAMPQSVPPPPSALPSAALPEPPSRPPAPVR
jgi:hypothetical protein